MQEYTFILVQKSAIMFCDEIFKISESSIIHQVVGMFAWILHIHFVLLCVARIRRDS